MAEILLSNRAISTTQLEQQCGITTNDIYDDQNTQAIFANQPYLVGKQPSRTELAILHTLRNAEQNQHLAEVSLSLGENETVAIAEMKKKLQDNSSSVIGSATGAYGARASGFQGAVQKYQTTLLKYRKTITTKSPKATQLGAKKAAFRAFEEMQHKFQLEMGVITNHTKARKGTPLTNPTRATNIARHGRNAAKLHVTSQAQAHDLVNFSKHARNLGTGLVVIDFADRIGKIHNSYRAGGNWEREMFIESLSFTGSTVTGSLVASWGVSALTFTLVATPIGWVGLIIGGAIVVGASASASIYANSELKDNSGNWYDAIQNSIKSL